jgi:hypothetical protein
LKLKFSEVSIKSTEATVILSTIPSVEDIDESIDMSHRPLAPLASSETFSDVTALTRDDQPKQEMKTASINNENKFLNPESSCKPTKSHFDSLEILFDFSSSGISNDIHVANENSTQDSSHIRSSETNPIINTNKVVEFFLQKF